MTCLAVIEELEDWRGTMEAMAECVAGGGVLYVTMSNGRWLTRAYEAAERMGKSVRASSWHYARASLKFPLEQAADGFGLRALEDWHFVDVTPYLARAAYGTLRGLPMSVTSRMVSVVSPSFAFAWQRLLNG